MTADVLYAETMSDRKSYDAFVEEVVPQLKKALSEDPAKTGHMSGEYIRKEKGKWNRWNMPMKMLAFLAWHAKEWIPSYRPTEIVMSCAKRNHKGHIDYKPVREAAKMLCDYFVMEIELGHI